MVVMSGHVFERTALAYYLDLIKETAFGWYAIFQPIGDEVVFSLMSGSILFFHKASVGGFYNENSCFTPKQT